MPSVVIEVTRYDDETGVVSVLSEQKVFTENFDGTAVLYSVSSVPVNPIPGSTTCFVCPHCELREVVHLPSRGLNGHWGPAGPHDIRLPCKKWTWHGCCDHIFNPESKSRWAEDGVFEPGIVHLTTTRGSGWTVLTPAQSAAWNARADAQSDSDSD